jgi:hypothetical protein
MTRGGLVLLMYRTHPEIPWLADRPFYYVLEGGDPWEGSRPAPTFVFSVWLRTPCLVVSRFVAALP